MMKYSFPGSDLAFHAVDLIPLFTNNRQEVFDIVKAILEGLHVEHAGLLATLYASYLNETIRQTYKNYFASFALSGNPNEGILKSPLAWPVADGSLDKLSNVMEVKHIDPDFNLTTDDQNVKSTCLFWTEIAKEVMATQMDTDDGRGIQPPSDIGEL